MLYGFDNNNNDKQKLSGVAIGFCLNKFSILALGNAQMCLMLFGHYFISNYYVMIDFGHSCWYRINRAHHDDTCIKLTSTKIESIGSAIWIYIICSNIYIVSIQLQIFFGGRGGSLHRMTHVLLLFLISLQNFPIWINQRASGKIHEEFLHFLFIC